MKGRLLLTVTDVSTTCAVSHLQSQKSMSTVGFVRELYYCKLYFGLQVFEHATEGSYTIVQTAHYYSL